MGVNDLSLRQHLALKLHQVYKKNETQLHQLNYLLWECTLRCNLHCLHCGSDCKQSATVRDMPAADFLKAVDQIIPIVDPNITTIVITGGEPLMRRDLEQVGIELYQRGFPWGIVTNGLLLTDDRIRSLIGAGMRSITVSLDGLADSHNWLRGNSSSFKNAFRAIESLAKISELNFDVVTCVNQRNFTELPGIRQMLIESGVKAWRLFTIFPIGRATQEKELMLPSKEFMQLFEFIKQTREEGNIHLNYGCEGYLGRYEGQVRDNLFFCSAGISVASILADGSISACPNLRDNFIQGNIYRDNFADVWQNRFQKLRDRSWTKSGDCASCNSYKYCQGNGLHLRDEKSGDLLFCHLKRIEEGENYHLPD